MADDEKVQDKPGPLIPFMCNRARTTEIRINGDAVFMKGCTDYQTCNSRGKYHLHVYKMMGRPAKIGKQPERSSASSGSVPVFDGGTDDPPKSSMGTPLVYDSALFF
eukprot:gnl/TRDRNA2_/TRDRNA2_182505_c0_seq1.p1 gnl/TRDRNA2_/TRDRNA2_182505_c0~~gnl/TRDRNA2_/TRDRNA2_182505_c0_seq1.p1  ORF type:complete len:107 (-),score=17.98 gnl/TRDRNA2_/TRDRNA2_182505_c0_seq1:76-396(-)